MNWGAGDFTQTPGESVIRVAGVVCALFLIYFAAFQFVNYGTYLGAAVLVALAFASLLSGLVQRKGHDPVAYLAGLLVVAASATAYFRGGLIPGVLLWLIVPPTVNLFFFRLRQALFWVVVCGGAVGIIGTLEQYGFTPPRVESTEMGLLTGMIGALLCCVVVVFFQAWSRRQDQIERENMQRRLFRANKLESIARLASGVAHDFGNLLSVIDNHASLLTERMLDPSDREDLDAIQKAAGAGSTLTQQLLAIGQERDHAERRGPIDVNDVGAKAATLLQALLPRDVTFRFRPADVPPVVESNSADIHQVLMNLVLNARDAMPTGGELVMEVDVVEQSEPLPLRFGLLDPGQYVVLSVCDEGVGMSEALMNQVVEPFFTTRGKRGGTGLGLSIVYGVSTSLNGQMDIVSKVDEGTTFSVYLPFCDLPVPELESGTVSTFAARVLLVDDDSAVRRALSRLIGSEGHDVVSAESADDARQLFAKGAFDVLVSDVSMPGDSGIELAVGLLRQQPTLGVVLLSGDLPHGDKPAELSGANVRYLNKPAGRGELQTAIVQTADVVRRQSHVRLAN